MVEVAEGGAVVVVVVPARSGPATTTTAMPEVFETGTDEVSGCTEVAPNPSEAAMLAAACCWPVA